jgi:hypothetical protein
MDLILNKLIGKIENGQNIFLVAHNDIKTTLLVDLNNNFKKRKKKLITPVFIDFLHLDIKDSSLPFWVEVFSQGGIVFSIDDERIKSEILHIFLDDIIGDLDDKGLKYLLILDNLQVGVDKEQGYGYVEIFGQLRTIISLYTCFVAVLGSTVRASKMNEILKPYNKDGSPFFNVYLEEVIT